MESARPRRAIRSAAELYRIPPYHLPMVRLLLALMLVLLPLRGWMGDAMAMQHLAAATATIENVATLRHSTLASGHFDAESGEKRVAGVPLHCHDDGAPALSVDNAGNSVEQSDTPAGHGTCGACSVCHAVALQIVSVWPADADAPSLAPTTGVESFASATPLRGQKPPIS